MRAAGRAHQGVERGRARLDTAEAALPMCRLRRPPTRGYFYNELAGAIRGRLSGADTIARVNDALRDRFQAFVLSSPVTPARRRGHPGRSPSFGPERRRPWTPRLERATEEETTTPPLRALHAPSSPCVNAHGYAGSYQSACPRWRCQSLPDRRGSVRAGTTAVARGDCGALGGSAGAHSEPRRLPRLPS